MYLLGYRSSKHKATGVSPAELYFARDLKLSLDLLRGTPPEERKENSIDIRKLKKNCKMFMSMLDNV